jgi:Family of unknown function (DUF6502)
VRHQTTREAGRRRPVVQRRPTSTLDPRSLEAVARFVRVLARCGCAPEDIGREVVKACRQVPRSWAPKARAALREMDDASHVLTLWFSDPAYLDARGNPLPLSIRGAGGSLEALARRVDGNLEAREVLRYLSARGALRRVGARYIPRGRVLSLRGARGPDNFRHLRGLLGMLRTLEHNGQPKRRVPGWFEAFAENPRFPISARPGFDKRLRVHANKLLLQLDADMHRQEQSRKSGERTVRIGVGIYRFEDALPPRTNRSARRRNRSR